VRVCVDFGLSQATRDMINRLEWVERESRVLHTATTRCNTIEQLIIDDERKFCNCHFRMVEGITLSLSGSEYILPTRAIVGSVSPSRMNSLPLARVVLILDCIVCLVLLSTDILRL